MKNLITVMKARFSNKDKCSFKSCKRKVDFLLFYWDGKPMLSRLSLFSCKKHLAHLVLKQMNEDKKFGCYCPSVNEEFAFWLNKVKTTKES